jgi:site-specific DNA-cytosine methylase
LADVLLETVPDRFFLSPRAAAGILRRAEKRGRELPRALAEALTALASQHQEDDKRTTRTSSTPSTDREEGPMTTAPKQDTWSAWDVRNGIETGDEAKTLTGGEHQSYSLNNMSLLSSVDTPKELTVTPPMPLSQHRSSADPAEASQPLSPQDTTPTGTSSVRRLTPTECERLQGFPDGWTIPRRTARDTQRWETPSPSTSPSGSAGGSSPTRKDD